jgi:hypothetical protein
MHAALEKLMALLEALSKLVTQLGATQTTSGGGKAAADDDCDATQHSHAS